MVVDESLHPAILASGWRPSPSSNNYVHWSGANADRYSQIVAEIGVIPLGAPIIKPMVAEAMKLFMANKW